MELIGGLTVCLVPFWNLIISVVPVMWRWLPSIVGKGPRVSSENMRDWRGMNISILTQRYSRYSTKEGQEGTASTRVPCLNFV